MNESDFPVSRTLGQLQPSMTLGITASAKAMKAQGVDVVSLCAGEPDFDTPYHIKAAAIAALEEGDTKYTPVPGRRDLREAIAAKLERDNGIRCTADRVLVAPGAKFSVFSTVAVLCQPGDEVLIPAPCWLSYPEMVRAAGAKPVIVPAPAAGTGVDVEAVRARVTPATKLLILNSPSNPAGTICSRAALEAIAALACERGFLVLADEIYEKLVYDGAEHVSLASVTDAVADRTITVNGFSKAYSMTGWRLGYLAGPAWLVPRINALQSHSTSGATSFAQAGALAAVTGTQEPVAQMRAAFQERRDRIFKLLSEIPGIRVTKPQGAFYIFPNIGAFGIDSMTFAKRLLDTEKVAVIPGLPFAADDHIRLSYACSLETIEKACARLAAFCAGL